MVLGCLLKVVVVVVDRILSTSAIQTDVFCVRQIGVREKN